MSVMADVYLETDVLVRGDLVLKGVPMTRPFRVPCMVATAYTSVWQRPYRTVRQCCWYHSVQWSEATSVAGEVLRQALTQMDGRTGPREVWDAVVRQHLPHHGSHQLRQAVDSLTWGQPIIASGTQITTGVHRITAMRHQGVKSTPGLIPARAGQWLSEVPGAYPHQHPGCPR